MALACASAAAGAPSLPDAPSGAKPPLDSLLKARSITKLTEDYDIITNSEWDENDFSFVNATVIRAPFSYAGPKVVDFSLYPKMSPAIQKFAYDPATRTIELVGEAYGLRMHSWIKVDQEYDDIVRFTIIRGDMTGFKVNAYLWDRDGKTVTVAKGILPGAKQMLPSLVALVFKPVSEIVLGVATKNFRSYIEEDYRKMKR